MPCKTTTIKISWCGPPMAPIGSSRSSHDAAATTRSSSGRQMPDVAGKASACSPENPVISTGHGGMLILFEDDTANAESLADLLATGATERIR